MLKETMYGKYANGYIWWDICTTEESLAKVEESELEIKKQKKNVSSGQILKERYEVGDPNVGLLGDTFGNFDYYILYSGKEEETNPLLSRRGNCRNKPSPKPPSPNPSSLPPYYQKMLPKINKKPKSRTLECNMFSPASTLYSLDYPLREDFKKPQKRTKCVWKIRSSRSVMG